MRYDILSVIYNCTIYSDFKAKWKNIIQDIWLNANIFFKVYVVKCEKKTNKEHETHLVH